MFKNHPSKVAILKSDIMKGEKGDQERKVKTIVSKLRRQLIPDDNKPIKTQRIERSRFFFCFKVMSEVHNPEVSISLRFGHDQSVYGII